MMENFFRGNHTDESCPMEIDSHDQEMDIKYGQLLPFKEMPTVVKYHKHNIPTEIDSCKKECNVSSRTCSLPNLSRNANKWDQESSYLGGKLSQLASSKSPVLSLNKSVSYEQCYFMEGNGIQKDPYVSVRKVEQSFEYYSPKSWKTKLVVETLTQKLPVAPQYISISGVQSKNKRTKTLRNVVYPVKDGDISTISSNTVFKCLFFILIPILLLVFSVAVFPGPFIRSKQSCEDHLDLGKIDLILSHEIFGQSVMVKLFMNALKEIFIPTLNDGVNNSTLSIIIFIGGTGVGKSYTASLFSDLYPEHWSQLHLNAQVDLTQEESKVKAMEEIVNKLSHCGTNLIIIDDASEFMLSSSRENRESFVKELYFSAKNEGKKTLLVLIVNDRKGNNSWNSDMTSTQRLANSAKFMKSLGDIQTYAVQFTPLSREHVVKCIGKYLEREGLHIQDIEISQLLEKESESFPNGCKGIYKYVHQLLTKTHSEEIHNE